jgi:hypothetical protein
MAADAQPINLADRTQSRMDFEPSVRPVGNVAIPDVRAFAPRRA